MSAYYTLVVTWKGFVTHASLHSTEEKAAEYLVALCKAWWEEEIHGELEPTRLEGDDMYVVDKYFKGGIPKQSTWDIQPCVLDPIKPIPGNTVDCVGQAAPVVPNEFFC